MTLPGSACRRAALLAAAFAVFAGTAVAQETPRSGGVLRVCADPNNLPFSNDKGEGFENKLAELVARDLGETVAYTWHAQRRGFIRETLKAGKCDVVMGVPHMDMLTTTRPYYRSGYVFVSRRDAGLTFSSMNAPELRRLKIGVPLVGDDGANAPPAHALGQEGIVGNVIGYTVYGDYRQDSPPSRLIQDVANGTIDVAAAWGPLAGYFAKRSPVPLRVVPITDTVDYLPLVFQFSIAMGVRRGDDAIKEKLNDVLQRRRGEIKALLDAYGVPQF